MEWVEGLPFNELALSTAASVRLPAFFGVKLISRLHVAPGTSENPVVQSGVGPEPNICEKSGPTVIEVSTSAWLPEFWITTDCGLSLLVDPTEVLAKLNVGGCET